MIKDHAFKHLPISFLEDMKAEIDAELQFRHLCDTVYAEEIFNGADINVQAFVDNPRIRRIR